MKDKIIIGIVSVIAIFGILTIVYISLNKPEDYSQVTKIKTTDRIKWSPEKKNILVVYSDFLCPACKMFNDVLSQLESTKSADFVLTKKITFVFRHYPIHEQSFPITYAVEAAGLQGKYYEMIDLIYKNQESIAKSSNLEEALNKLAQELKLNMTQFNKDIKSPEVVNKVNTDLQSGQKAGINATPTFFFNGKKLEFKTLEEFKKLLSV